jgi:hypothetical protein
MGVLVWQRFVPGCEEQVATFSEHRPNRWIVAIVVACAIVAFVLCYLLLRLNGPGEVRGQETSTVQPSIPATHTDKELASEASAPPSRGEQMDLPEENVPAPPGESKNQANGPAPTADTPPRSITFRASRSHEKRSATESLVQTDGSELSDTQLKERVWSIEVNAELKGCDGCSSSKTRHIVVPRTCIYSSHTLTQLHREPYVPIEQAKDRFTTYTDYLDPDAKGRIEVVRLIVEAYRPGGSPVIPSITMRLTVVAECPSDANVGG